MSRRDLGAIVLLEVHGRLESAASPARESVLMALAEEPPAVICDLSTVTGPYSPEALDLLLSIGLETRDWLGSPLVLLCGTSGLGAALRHRMTGDRLALVADLPTALTTVARAPRRTVARMSLAPVARSAPLSRAFVAEKCQEWGFSSQTSAATLIASELVTNALLHARSRLELTLSQCDGRLRLSVRDAHPQRPVALRPSASRPTGRGIMLVGALSHSWGVLPTAGGGKVVWSVLPRKAGAVSGPSPDHAPVTRLRAAHDTGATGDSTQT